MSANCLLPCPVGRLLLCSHAVPEDPSTLRSCILGWGTQRSEAGVGEEENPCSLSFTFLLIFFTYSLGMLAFSTWHLVEPIAFESYIPVSLSQVRKHCRSLQYPVKIPLQRDNWKEALWGKVNIETKDTQRHGGLIIAISATTEMFLQLQFQIYCIELLPIFF